MSTTQRRFRSGVIDRLAAEPYRFEFFQAVRLLLGERRRHFHQKDADVLGQEIRFRNSVSLAFPASEIESLELEPSEDEPELPFGQVTMTPSFIGLTGPLGVMPRHYTQYVAEREVYHRDHATRAFLDIFTSRAVALFYQAWLKYRLHFQYEADRKRHFLPHVLRLAGLPETKATERVPPAGISAETLAYYAGPLRERPRSIQRFARTLEDYFGVRCEPEQFVGQWIELPAKEQTSLGAFHCTLGTDSFCGGRYWDRQSKVRLTLGPMRKAKFEEFLPQGNAEKKLRYFFALMIGPTFECEVRLKLDRRDIAPAILGEGRHGVRLGWCGWLTSEPAERELEDVVYRLNA